jgi:hypothetical protein
MAGPRIGGSAYRYNLFSRRVDAAFVAVQPIGDVPIQTLAFNTQVSMNSATLAQGQNLKMRRAACGRFPQPTKKRTEKECTKCT